VGRGKENCLGHAKEMVSCILIIRGKELGRILLLVVVLVMWLEEKEQISNMWKSSRHFGLVPLLLQGFRSHWVADTVLGRFVLPWQHRLLPGTKRSR
jgi:hypothetical protein